MNNGASGDFAAAAVAVTENLRQWSIPNYTERESHGAGPITVLQHKIYAMQICYAY